MNGISKNGSPLNTLVFVLLVVSLAFSFVSEVRASGLGQTGADSDESSDVETFAVACYNGVSYPWAGSLWNRSSRDMIIKGGVHIGGNQYETKTYTLGPGEDSRNTDMCDVDQFKHDISPPGKWRYYLVDKNVGDWANVWAFRPTCNDPPENQEEEYGVKCG